MSGIRPRVAKRHTAANVDKGVLREWCRILALGRQIDDRAPNYLKQALGWSYHAPCAGHDAIQLALGRTFVRGEDHLFPYYRDLVTVLAAGLTPEEIILNGISKATDAASGGRHMSNHFAKPAWNIHNVSSCVGNHALHAAGVARAMVRYKRRGVAICSMGESAMSEGYCYEAVNGASRENLPVVLVLQDNGYGISVPKSEQTANEFVADNFSGFANLRIIHCDGLDVFDSMNAMAEARAHAVAGLGPVIVHAPCVRIHSHSNSDRHELYRDEGELAEARAADPVARFRALVSKKRLLSKKEMDAMDEDARRELMEAHKAALAAPDPDPASVRDHVLPPARAARAFPDGVHDHAGEPVRLIDAIGETLKDEFRRNPDAFFWGQDVASKDKGGVFNVSKGMQREFGAHRVFNAPIAEDYIMGTANGFSRLSPDIRVVVEGAEFADYFWPAMEQFVETSHEHWRTNGAFSPNIVVRLASGGYIGGGLYHSQNIEASLAPLPGCRIVAPSFADDAAGLLRTCVRSQGLSVFLEPKALYNAKSAMTPVPPDFEVPFGKARTRREGRDLSVVTYGNASHLCLGAARRLAREGAEAEVVDLRSLAPLDEEAVLASVAKTGRCLVVHEDKVFGGFGGELAALVAERAFESLDAPVRRVGGENVPVGFHRALERAALPDEDRVLAAMRDLAAY